MERKQDYSSEFRKEAVKLVTEQGLTQGEAARRLTIPRGTLAHWVAAAREASTSSHTVAELEQEILRLCKELTDSTRLS